MVLTAFYPAAAFGRDISPGLPGARARIEDHLRSYLVIADCSMSLFPCYQFPFVAARGASELCGPVNHVGALSYRDPAIDDAVFETMTDQMQRDLRLNVASNALYFLSSAGPDVNCPPRSEATFQRLFMQVPFLWEGLIDRVAARIGCSSCGATSGAQPPVVSTADASRILDLLKQGIHTPGGNFWLGLPVLRSTPDCNPNLAVAIARVQHGMGDVPRLEAVQDELRRMGATVVP